MNPLCIITALPAESRVFIDALRLRHVHDYGWRLYARDHFLLLQTGLGKLKAASATGTLLHSRPDIAAIINVGIAGGTEPTGTCLQAHKITDVGSGASWYPHLPPRRLTPELQSTEVQTLDKVSTDYQSGVVFDMEAAGIVSAATAYLSTDAIQSIKVISDNTDTPVNALTKQTAIDYMQATVSPVMALLDWYQQQESSSTGLAHIQALLADITANTHHTVSESHQLKRLLIQYQSLTGCAPDAHLFQQLTSASAIRRQLEMKTTETPLTYEP